MALDIGLPLTIVSMALICSTISIVVGSYLSSPQRVWAFLHKLPYRLFYLLPQMIFTCLSITMELVVILCLYITLVLPVTVFEWLLTHALRYRAELKRVGLRVFVLRLILSVFWGLVWLGNALASAVVFISVTVFAWLRVALPAVYTHGMQVLRVFVFISTLIFLMLAIKIWDYFHLGDADSGHEIRARSAEADGEAAEAADMRGASTSASEAIPETSLNA